MVDVVDKATRSRMMSGIGSKNTSPEIAVRSVLHRSGFRFRIHVNHLPGKPDIVLKKYRAVVFVHGCFWHKHKCHLFKWPENNAKFWRRKINLNAKKDACICESLQKQGWRVVIVWECALKGKGKISMASLIEKLSDWLHGDRKNLVIQG